MDFIYREKNEFFAQITHGLEAMGEEELKELGAKKIKQVYRGLIFHSDLKTMYKINYQSRLISRVLAPLKRFYADKETQLYNNVKSIPWENFLSVDDTFAIFSNVSKSKIKHSKYAALLSKDAIADRFSKMFGKRPSVDTENPDLWISVYIDRNRVEVSLDMSGGTLAKRGYRRKASIAPMPETLAAAIIRLSKWNGEKTLNDPMCGSGTILAEALMHYCKIPSAYLRENFGFFKLPEFDNHDWILLKNKANSEMRELPERMIIGSDISSKSVSVSISNLSRLPYGEDVIVSKKDFKTIPELKNRMIITNPPYGVRMDDENLAELYKDLGDFFKQKCTGSTAFVYTANLDMVKKVGLRTSAKIILNNSNLEGRLLKYEIY